MVEELIHTLISLLHFVGKTPHSYYVLFIHNKYIFDSDKKKKKNCFLKVSTF